MKKQFMNIIYTNCISYTILSLLISILSFTSIPVMEMNYMNCLSMFLVTVLISICIVLTSNIKIESFWIENIIYVLEVFVIVYGVGGGIFHWFPLELYYFFEVGIICILVYIITSIILYLHFHLLANQINQKIEEKKHEHNRG